MKLHPEEFNATLFSTDHGLILFQGSHVHIPRFLRRALSPSPLSTSSLSLFFRLSSFYFISRCIAKAPGISIRFTPQISCCVRKQHHGTSRSLASDSFFTPNLGEQFTPQ